MLISTKCVVDDFMAVSELIDGIFMALFRNALMKMATFSRGFWTVNMTIKGGPLFSLPPPKDP